MDRHADMIRKQEQKLMNMPLTSDELHILSRLRSTIYTYTVMLGTLGLGSGLAMTHELRPLPRLAVTAGFTAISGFMGIAVGMQKGLLKLDELGGGEGEGEEEGLVREWRVLNEMKARARRRGEDDGLESVFRSR
jgi:hypothetical protein